ncbi:unnamed protein product, partial [Brassica rapa subsp. trilocularis]
CHLFLGISTLESRYVRLLHAYLILCICPKHQRKWKSVPNYTKSWYDRGPEIYQAEKYRKGARKTGSVSENGMLYTGVKKLETVMVDAVCFSTFTSFLIVQS